MLVSLHLEITARLPDAVADARDSYHSWAEIADLLGTTRAAAWNHYGRPDRTRHPTPRHRLTPTLLPEQVGPNQTVTVGPIQVDRLTWPLRAWPW